VASGVPERREGGVAAIIYNWATSLSGWAINSTYVFIKKIWLRPGKAFLSSVEMELVFLCGWAA